MISHNQVHPETDFTHLQFCPNLLSGHQNLFSIVLVTVVSSSLFCCVYKGNSGGLWSRDFYWVFFKPVPLTHMDMLCFCPLTLNRMMRGIQTHFWVRFVVVETLLLLEVEKNIQPSDGTLVIRPRMQSKVFLEQLLQKKIVCMYLNIRYVLTENIFKCCSYWNVTECCRFNSLKWNHK